MVKTQKQILERMEAYKNGTVDSPYRITKPTSYNDYFGVMEAGCIDVQGSDYHAQCMDLVMDYVLWFTDGKIRLWGNAKDIPHNKLNDYFTWHDNTPNYVPPVGAIGVNSYGQFAEYGHTYLVYKQPTQPSMIVLEQNWDGRADTKPTPRLDYYTGCTGFWVPKVAKSAITQKVASVKNTVLQGLKSIVTSNKMRILLVAGHGNGAYSNDSGAVGNGTTERDFIRANIVPRVAKHLTDAGHSVTLYGGSKMEYDMFQYTRYGQAIGNYKDYGMYWAARQKFDAVVEFHLDAAGASASGGHVIIGTGQTADKIDLGIQDVIKHYVGLIRNIDPRNNLLNVNVAKDYGVNYRLVELGFITSKKDMDNIKNNLANFTRDIANAISGNTVVKADVKKAEPKKEDKKPAPKPAPKPAIQVGSIPPKNLKWSKSPYLVARIKDDIGVTITRRSGDSRANYEWNLSDEKYYNRNIDFYIYEVIDGWCRVYSESNNGWIWHERLKVTKKF